MCVSSNPSRRLVPSLALSNKEASLLVSRMEEWDSSQNSKDQNHHRVTHDYHDHLFDTRNSSTEPVARGGVMTPFPVKLHSVLDSIEEDGLSNVVGWQPHGRCFVVRDSETFLKEVMPKYFNQTKIASFQRQLNLYGFQRLTRGPDKGGYYHELFLRGKVWLSHKIHRIKVKGTKVRAKSNPGEEPNFYSMPPVRLDDSFASSNTSDDAPPAEAASDMAPEQVVSEPTVVSPHASPVASPRPPDLELKPLDCHPELPISTSSPVVQDKDEVLFFEGRPFHYLDHIEPRPWIVPCYPEEVDPEREMQKLFASFNIPRPDISSSFGDDESFGNMLETLLCK